jgi:predicted O-linked N-acetylglucosamine transferase (SPINDLY family)
VAASTTALDQAVALVGSGRWADAAALCQSILAQEPANAGALLLAGRVALEQGLLEVAVRRFVDGAKAGGPRAADAVVERFRQLAAESRRLDVHHWHGVLLRTLGRKEDAIAAFRRALAIDRDQPGTQYCLAQALMDCSIVDEAIVAYRETIRLLKSNPSQTRFLAAVHSEFGFALMIHGEQEAGIQAFRRAIALQPDHATHAQLVYYLRYLPSSGVATVLREAREWDRLYAAPLRSHGMPHLNDTNPDRRLRVGYVSANLHRWHPVTNFVPPVFERHDREQFEVIAYANVAKPDATTEWFRSKADRWRDVVGMDDDAVARLVREDGVDVLVDLSMHTSGARLLVFARKPAPVQVCWLAYPGTTGMQAMDYRVTDPYLDPPELDGTTYWQAYSEKPLRLADTFWCYRPQVSAPVAPLPARRSGHPTFGTCNSFLKVHDGTLKLWARVLAATPSARCFLVVPSFTAQARVREVFKKLGVRTERLELVGTQELPAYLDNYGHIDVGLDTLPCGGGTSSLDAFYMGVPVVTLSGHSAEGRAGACFAHNLGMPELVASTEDEYVRVATRLAGDLDRLEETRHGLRERMLASPLMDEVRFVRELERGYRHAWREWCASHPADRG